MHKDFREDYGSIQTRIDVRKSLTDPEWDNQEVVASYGDRFTLNVLKKFKKEIDLIDEYLRRIGKPYDYVSINERGGVERFTALIDILQKEEKKKTRDMEMQKIKLSGFWLIYNSKSTYSTLRDYDKVLLNQQARSEFQKNSKAFTDYPRRGNEFDPAYVDAEIENLEIATATVRSVKKDAKKLARDALKTLERIKTDNLPKNNREFKSTLEQLGKKINDLKSRAG